MALPVQPRRREVFNDIEIRADRQQHRNSDESGWRWIAGDGNLGKILQNLPQAPERPRIYQMEVCTRILLHELLVVCENVKVWLRLPLFQSFVKLPRIPSRQRNIPEQWRFQEIEFWLADHLKDWNNDFKSQTRIKHSIDDELHLKTEIYRREASTNGMHNCMSSLAKIKSKAANFSRRGVTMCFVTNWESWFFNLILL